MDPKTIRTSVYEKLAIKSCKDTKAPPHEGQEAEKVQERAQVQQDS